MVQAHRFSSASHLAEGNGTKLSGTQEINATMLASLNGQGVGPGADMLQNNQQKMNNSSNQAYYSNNNEVRLVKGRPAGLHPNLQILKQSSQDVLRGTTGEDYNNQTHLSRASQHPPQTMLGRTDTSN